MEHRGITPTQTDGEFEYFMDDGWMMVVMVEDEEEFGCRAVNLRMKNVKERINYGEKIKGSPQKTTPRARGTTRNMYSKHPLPSPEKYTTDCSQYAHTHTHTHTK